MKTFIAIAAFATFSQAIRLEEVEEVKEAFDYYDMNGDGTITVSDKYEWIENETGFGLSSFPK